MLLQQGAVSSAYLISSGSAIILDSYHLVQASSTATSASTPSSVPSTASCIISEPAVTLQLPEGVSAVVLGTSPTSTPVSASAAVADATAVASVTSRLFLQQSSMGLSPMVANAAAVAAPFEASDEEAELEGMEAEKEAVVDLMTSLIVDSQANVASKMPADVPASAPAFEDNNENKVLLPPQTTSMGGTGDCELSIRPDH